MFYFFAEYFADAFSPLNVLRYHTVRAGGAMFTGFLVSILIGPMVLRFLRALKIGQFIKKDHVQDLHELHKGKAGTPTMGGLLIIIATLASLLLWSDFTNPLLLIATFVLVAMGGVGFMDDYIKLRRKHNDGLSARAKFAGQITVGTLLGLAVVVYPTTVGHTTLDRTNVDDWSAFANALDSAADNEPLGKFAVAIPAETRVELSSWHETLRPELIRSLNDALDSTEIWDEVAWLNTTVSDEASGYIERGVEALSRTELQRLNRLLLESAAPAHLAASPQNVHTRVAVPGFRELLIPLGILYVPFVIFVLVGTTNAVNLTDGLDGLAAGASVVSIGAFTAMAYVVSRADWSSYLFVMHIPLASELAVFGAALLGTGLGFLWFNAHPAEVFMGDTGSLALGGVLAAMAIMLKQELLLPIVGGLFVIEALSVIIQVGSFKLRKKRVFRMAPLHHHFELLGWSETKVTIRFWIIALLFALLSLATLKLR